MAAETRVEQKVTRWHYRGQTKIHEVPHVTAKTHEHGAVADEINEAAAAQIEEYRLACERGVAVIVPD